MTPTKSPSPSPKPTPESQITSSSLSPFQKSVLLLLLQIPPGRFTTYAVLASHLSTSPRAVGNALRRNPFAPQVPCHRVVATGGLLGGFKGKVGGRDGADHPRLEEKRALLLSEGVKTWGREGRVTGRAFDEFV
ncbi:6-O-methylguanine DNA methyltransferase [Lasiosphaeris hirsuta]|uniref:Methylated-DNA--protein-cysteine methyltransferase n=1 Tax=Lasiosphaeris hirsuta TaxID=260670 RepID=A0AA39ZWH0_9PEZI|nr:6-O-methylguanine DNA methyltransferase [Lasiosphaeris hirsuta]